MIADTHIMEQTSHTMWVNSQALKAVSISAATEDPQGGHIVKFERVLQGILLDNAGDVVIFQALANNTDIENQNYQGLIEFGLPTLAENGITLFVKVVLTGSEIIIKFGSVFMMKEN
jgi:predicted amidohydrolase YtcJ